jgi:hypothetical protein
VAAVEAGAGDQPCVPRLGRQALGLLQVGDAQARVEVAAQLGEGEQQQRASRRVGPLLLQQRQGGLVALGGGQPGVGPLRALARPDQPLGSPRVPRLPEVVGHRVGVRTRQRGERLADPPVEPAAAQRGRALIQGLTDQRVREAHAAVRGLRHETRPNRPLGRLQQAVLVAVGDRRPQLEGHVLSDYRGDRQEPLLLLAQPVQPPLDHLPQQGGHAHPAEVAQRPTAIVSPQQLLLLQGPQQLAGEEGVPLRPLVEVAGQPGLLRLRQRVAGAD